MSRKEKVYEELILLCKDITLEKIKNGFTGFDATTISERVGTNRNNTSKELNILVSEKKVVKIQGRPVYFFERNKLEEILEIKLKDAQLEVESIKELINSNQKSNRLVKDNIFDKIIGSQGSLEVAIKQAKAAILYPPSGLHTLLIGSTGVGKTTFAEMMYNYALEIGKIESGAQFTIFNCAEYADNPQLLLSQLFGYVKGAFTGAEKDKIGIIEKANGGILLLDEIHRLTPEGQEMLFLLMDKNIYRRLGETDNTREANVLLIGATTEDIESNLLKTFIRRIPMIIRLPSLLERPISERFQLVKQFFRSEVKCVQVPIKIYKDVMKAFLLYDCKGNIGQLKGDIQLTCARGFLDYKTQGKENIEIDTPLIPEHIYIGLLNSKEKREEIIKLLKLNKNKYYRFSQSSTEEYTTIDEYNLSEDLYKEISDKYRIYSKKGYTQSKINNMINNHIEKYLQELLKKCSIKQEMPENQELFKVVSPRVYYSVDVALKVAEQKLKKKFSKKVYIALSLHISALMERISQDRSIDNSVMNEIALNNPNEFHTAKLIREILQEELEIDIPKDEIGFIAMFLYAVDSDELQKAHKIGVIVLAHGRNTASSIAHVANSLLGTNHCKAIDMPLDEKVEDILEKTIELSKEVDQGKGVLLLVDMGSLVAFAEIISKKININIQSVEMVSTPIVLEAVRKSLLPEMTLEILSKELQRTTPYIGRLVTNNIKCKASVLKPRTIITTCITGEGSAIKLAELMKNTLPIIDEYNIKLKPYNKDKFENDKKEDKEILVVVGTIDLKIPNVPFIPIDEVIIGDGFKKIEKLITNVEGLTNYSTTAPNVVVGKMLKEYLMFLDPIKAYETVSESFEILNNLIKIKDYKRIKIGFLLHNCCMIERVLKKESMSYNNVDKLIQSKPKLYKALKNSLTSIEGTFGIKIPDTEVGYIMDIFDTQ